ncbi:MAG: DUF2341 domain-containing protein [Candidatus Solibacter sp.]
MDGASGAVYAAGGSSALVIKQVAGVEVWRRQLGGTSQDAVLALAVSPGGALYAAGIGGQGGFVAALAPDGTPAALLALPVAARALAIDRSGAVYVAGAGFVRKLTARLEPVYSANPDGEITSLAVSAAGELYAAVAGQMPGVARLSADGNRWLYHMNLGAVAPAGIALDEATGSVYVTGSTSSPHLTGNSAFRESLNGVSDAFVSRIDGRGQIVWSRYLGGSGSDAGTAIAWSPGGTLIVAGYTTSPDFPRSLPASRGNEFGGSEDGFLTTLDESGNIIESGYVGTPSRLAAIALSPADGGVYVAGWSGRGGSALLVKRIEAAVRTASASAFATTPMGLGGSSGFTLGTYLLTVGPSAGGNSVELIGAGGWTANTTANWLHLPLTTGTDGAVVTFSYDANGGATRTATITFNSGDLTLTVTQAGAAYVPATQLTTLLSTGLTFPEGVTLDASGNLYITDAGNSAIYEWSPLTKQVTTLISSGLNGPQNSAVDASGNIFFADFRNNVLKEYILSTKQVIVLPSSGYNLPSGVALDSAGKLYITDTFNDAVKKYDPVTQQTTTLISSGLSVPHGVAVDGLGNVYIADNGNNAVEVWNPTTQQLTTLVSSGLNLNEGVAVDGSGNVYIADGNDKAIKMWSPSTQQVTTLLSTGLVFPHGITVNGPNDIYIGDSTGGAVRELTLGFVAPASFVESAAAGTDALLPVLPSGSPVTATSDQSWLTIGTIANGVVNFSFTANSSTVVRVANISVLGSQIPVTQTAGSASGITVNPGTAPQSASINTAFASPLAVTVRDAANNPMPGMSVTFTAPSSGAGGTFSGGLSTVTVISNGAGVAAAPFTANGTVGANYTVTAVVNGLVANLTLTNLSTAPAHFDVVAGTTPQSAPIDTAFGSALAVTVKDAGNNPMAGVYVTFTAPGSGPSGSFSNSAPIVTVATDSAGVASAALTANQIAGAGYTVTASTSGLSAIFTLTNLAGPPASLAASSGTTPQSANANTAFATALAVQVQDVANNPVPGLSVTFLAPGTGASGKFSNGTPTIVVPTNSAGVASAPFTANGIAGSNYLVTATASAFSANFTLTNTPSPPASISTNQGTTPQSATVSTAFAAALAVTVKDAGGNPDQGLNVTFTAPATGASGTFSNGTSAITATTDSSGMAAAPFTANGTPGTNYTVTATVGGLSANFTLSNVVPMVQVTLQTLPAGLSYTVDNANTFIAPATLTWVIGSVHTIATASTQPGAAGTQYIFTGWSDNGGLTHSVTAPASPATYTASFKTQYLLTAGVAPANTGVVAGGGVFYDAGANVPVTATPIANFGFAGWTGNVAASASAATTIAMTAPQSVTANFVLTNLPAGYLHYRAITIPHTLVPADQTNFPVLIQGVFPYLKTVSNGGLVLNTQGNDILFLSDRGQQVNWEMESYSPSTGAATFWVQVPTLSSVNDTTVYLFYGNPSVTSFQGNKQGTWDSNFAAVYHMSDNSATPAVSDATANGNNGTSQTSTSARTALGQIASGLEFNGTSDYVNNGAGSSVNLTGTFTLEGWVNLNSWPAAGYGGYLASKGQQYFIEFTTDNSGQNHGIVAGTYGPGFSGVANAIPAPFTGRFHHVAVDWDGAHWSLYVDGVLASQASGGGPAAGGQPFVTGAQAYPGGTNQFLNGIIDELRLSKVARSADWIATEYSNQSSPGTFFSMGAENSGAAGGPRQSVTRPMASPRRQRRLGRCTAGTRFQ